MSLESEFKEFEQHHREFLVHYHLLTTKKTKSEAAKARKSLQELSVLIKSMRKSIMEFKNSI